MLCRIKSLEKDVEKQGRKQDGRREMTYARSFCSPAIFDSAERNKQHQVM
jgi:hypothetical protein